MNANTLSPIIVDVRESDEFDSEHVPNSIHSPLSNFDRCGLPLLNGLEGKPVVLLCRSGNRARLALEQARRLGYTGPLSVYEGGILAWKSQGKLTLGKNATALPLMRQVQAVAGSLVLISVILGFFIAPAFFGLAAFVGAGLTFAGLTGFCGMAILLSKMPWNTKGINPSQEAV